MNKNYSQLNGLVASNNSRAPNHKAGMMNNGYSNRTTMCDDGTRIDPSWMDYNIRRRGSHIYFYEEINEVTQMILEVMLREAINDVLTEHVGDIISGELPESVTIHLNSPGGYLSSGFALYDYIKTSQFPITCVVEGICASAATLIMLACPIKVMSPNSTFLMHQCSWGCWGDNRFMQDHAENAEKAMSKLRKIYFEETSIAKGRPDKERLAYIQHLLEHDYELSVEECVDFGIIDEPEDDDDDVELSEERVEKLQAFIKKLAKEQRSEDAKKEEAKKEKAQKKSKDSEKTQAPKKAPAKKPTKEKAEPAPEKKAKPAKKAAPKKAEPKEKSSDTKSE